MEIKIVLDEKLLDDKDYDFFHYDSSYKLAECEYGDFYIVSVYVPCVQRNLERRNFRAEFDYNFREYIEKLHNRKDVIICGDFNVCHKDIDISNLDKHTNLEIFADEDRGAVVYPFADEDYIIIGRKVDIL